MSIIKTENICKSFGSVEVLKNVSLTVEPGEVVVIIDRPAPANRRICAL